MRSSLPEVTIVLPTYNRASTLQRAVDSVLAQRFEDYELIIVDDGSTDATTEFDAGVDPRIRLIRQDNRGASAARNRGLDAATGRFITFLDSDDEWFPNALGLEVAFLRAHPDAHWINTEFVCELDGRPENRRALSEEYVPMADRVGSRSLDLPPGETDDYLRVYEEREPVGEWAGHWLTADELETVRLYRGDLFPHMRWGHQTWLPTLMMTRTALDTVGPFPEDRTSAVDYPYMGRLAQHFRSSFVSAVVARKNDTGPDGRWLTDHVASETTGLFRYPYYVNLLRGFDELYADDDDPELGRVRDRIEYEGALAAIRAGRRDEALDHLRSVAAFDRYFAKAHLVRMMVLAAGTGERSTRWYEWSQGTLGQLRRRLFGRPTAPAAG